MNRNMQAMNTVRIILGSAIVVGAFFALVFVFEWLYFLALIYQYSIQFAILIGVGFALYYVFDESNDVKK